MDEQDQPRKRVKLSQDANGAAASNNVDVEKELRAGISAYTAPNVAGFSGILKQRFVLDMGFIDIVG